MTYMVITTHRLQFIELQLIGFQNVDFERSNPSELWKGEQVAKLWANRPTDTQDVYEYGLFH